MMRYRLLAFCFVLLSIKVQAHAQQIVPASVMAGALLKKVPVPYPKKAKAAHITGAVVLKGLIGKDGKVESLEVLSGDKLLADPSIEAIRQWEYRPYLLNGEPTEVQTTITVNFAMGDTNPKMDKPDKPPSGYKRVSTQALEDLCVRPAIEYPELARRAGVEGDVAVQLVLGPDATIEDVKALSGAEMLREGAEQFVRAWRCMQPKKKNGYAEGVEGIVLVKYRLPAQQ